MRYLNVYIEIILILLTYSVGAWVYVYGSVAVMQDELITPTQPRPPLRQGEAISVYQEESRKITGVGSWYDYQLENGWSSKGHFVCATRDFPRYVYLEVTNLENGKRITCYTTDFGPDKEIHPDRIIDLSSASFEALAPLSKGLINVSVKEKKY